MNITYYIFFFIFGAVMGSFYHVVASRLSIPNGSILEPKRSYCPNCNHSLKWYELIPIVSYLLQLGKCRHCHKPISIMYMFIELTTGLLFLLSYHSFGISLELIIALALVSFLSIVIVSDLNYLIIPDEVTLTISIIIMVVNLFLYGIGPSLLKLGSGILLFVFMYLLMKLGNFLFKAESLGGGDIKLMFVVGLVVNPLIGLVVIFLASFIALPISLILYYINKEKVIPFGPFIIVSLVLVFFMKIDLNSIYNFLQTLVIPIF
ncbi:MAG: prepilin peptidase [Bacilli bacterium]